jgi:hypothetical protein
MASSIEWRGIVLLALLPACGAAAPIAAQPPAEPARQAPAPPPDSPALAVFRAAARKMSITYTAPAAYAEVGVRENEDFSYDYAIAAADRQIEMRFALRPYDQMPPPLRNRQMSFMFFMTGISNLVRGGDTGKIYDERPLPAGHFNADDARLVPVRWFRTDTGPGAFGDGFEAASGIFIHRDRVGDAYTFILLKDRDAIDEMDEETLHTMRFAAR